MISQSYNLVMPDTQKMELEVDVTPEQLAQNFLDHQQKYFGLGDEEMEKVEHYELTPILNGLVLNGREGTCVEDYNYILAWSFE
jgi:hypothetical protein